MSDAEYRYRPKGSGEDWLVANDPIVRLREALGPELHADLDAIESEVQEAVGAAQSGGCGATAARACCGFRESCTRRASSTSMPRLKFAEAVRAALAAELAADDDVVLIGEDIGQLGGVFTATQGLQERFGSDRVLDAPICENSLVGWGIGAAVEGMRPVVELMFSDFSLLALRPDRQPRRESALHDATASTRCRLSFACRLVPVRSTGPSTRKASSRCLRTFLGLWSRAERPCRRLLDAPRCDPMRRPGDLSREQVPLLSQHRRRRRGGRTTAAWRSRRPRWGGRHRRYRRHDDRVAASKPRPCCSARATARGSSCEVVDLRYIWPLDTETIAASVRKTGRLASCTRRWSSAAGVPKSPHGQPSISSPSSTRRSRGSAPRACQFRLDSSSRSRSSRRLNESRPHCRSWASFDARSRGRVR